MRIRHHARRAERASPLDEFHMTGWGRLLHLTSARHRPQTNVQLFGDNTVLPLPHYESAVPYGQPIGSEPYFVVTVTHVYNPGCITVMKYDGSAVELYVVVEGA